MKKYYLSVCCIVKNEAPYIEEFLEFHIKQGVEHFFMYEHESNDDTYLILKRYEALGLVTLQKIYGNVPQLRAYTDCLAKYGELSQWIAFIDCDEFLHVTNSVTSNLSEALKGFENNGAVAVNWVFYGSSGEEKYRNALVIGRFTKRSKNVDIHVKSIVQPHLTIGVGNNAHYFKLKKPAVNERGEQQPPEYHWSERPTAEMFRINHYHTKSKEEYYKRKSLHMDVDGVTRTAEVGFPVHDVNDISDPFGDWIISEVYEGISRSWEKYLLHLWDTKLSGKAWQVKEEFLSLLHYASLCKVKHVLEIGTHKGGTARGFLELGMKVISIDVVKQLEVQELEKEFSNTFKFMYRDEARGLDFSKVDLLWIDGDHSYLGCLQDWKEFSPYVREEGLVAFHDTLKNALHEQQGCEVWRVLEDLERGGVLKKRLNYEAGETWGGIAVLEK